MLTATITIQAALKVMSTKNPKFESVLALIRTDYAHNTSGSVPMWITAPAGCLTVGRHDVGATSTIRVDKTGRLSIFVKSLATRPPQRS